MSTAVADPVREGDRDEILDLFEEVFERPRLPSVWRWKYCTPWHSERPLGFVARVNGQIVAHVGLVSLPGRVRGRAARFFVFADFMVQEAHRIRLGWVHVARTAVFQAMRDAGLSVLYGVGERRRAAAYQHLGGHARVEAVVERTVGVESGGHSEDLGLDAQDWAWEAADLDMVWATCRDRVGTGLQRDGAYLRWRYRDHPTYDYRLVGVVRDRVPVGWIVLQDPDDNYRPDGELRVLDQCLPTSLIAPALRLAGRHVGARTLVLWRPSGCQDPRLERRPTPYRVVHQTFGEEVQVDGIEYGLGEADEWWW